MGIPTGPNCEYAWLIGTAVKYNVHDPAIDVDTFQHVVEFSWERQDANHEHIDYPPPRLHYLPSTGRDNLADIKTAIDAATHGWIREDKLFFSGFDIGA